MSEVAEACSTSHASKDLIVQDKLYMRKHSVEVHAWAVVSIIPVAIVATARAWETACGSTCISEALPGCRLLLHTNRLPC